MKKRVALLLSVLLCFTGCSKGETTITATEITSETSTDTISSADVSDNTSAVNSSSATEILSETSTDTISSADVSDNTSTVNASSETTTSAEAERVYVFDYKELNTDTERQFEILEKYFYGVWGEISLTYQDSYFSFDGMRQPYSVSETDDVYLIPFIDGGVLSCMVIEKNAPDIMYCEAYDFEIGGVCIAESSHKRIRTENDEPKLCEGQISLLGQMKLENKLGNTFTDSFNSVQDKPHTDKNGDTWVRGGSLELPVEKRYLVTYTDDKVELAVRYFNKNEFDAYFNYYDIPVGEREDLEQKAPTERYFILIFEKLGEAWEHTGTREDDNLL